MLTYVLGATCLLAFGAGWQSLCGFPFSWHCTWEQTVGFCAPGKMQEQQGHYLPLWLLVNASDPGPCLAQGSRCLGYTARGNTQASEEAEAPREESCPPLAIVATEEVVTAG